MIFVSISCRLPMQKSYDLKLYPYTNVIGKGGFFSSSVFAKETRKSLY